MSRSPKGILAENEPLKFQVFEWYDSNEETCINFGEIAGSSFRTDIDSVNDYNNSDEEKSANSEAGNDEYQGSDEEVEVINKYTIRIFGVTASGDSVCLTVKNFVSYFYVKVPDHYGTRELKEMLNYINFKTKFKYPKSMVTKNGYCGVFLKKDFFGFTNRRLFTFFKLVFNNSDAAKMASRLFNVPQVNPHTGYVAKSNKWNTGKFKVYEGNVDPMIRFIHSRNLKASGWIFVGANDFHINNNFVKKNSKCCFDVTCEWYSVFPCTNEEDESNGIAPLIQASFDIEVYSHDHSFPKPEIPENVVTQIATAFKRYTESDFFSKCVFTLKYCPPIEGALVQSFETEKELLLAWSGLISESDPDIIYSYNGDGFDWGYIAKRVEMLGIEEQFFSAVSKLTCVPAYMKDETFSSKAYSTIHFRRLKIPGRINFDIIIYIRREFKLDTYKLDAVAEKYLKQNKHEVTPKEIFQFFEDGTPEKIKIIAEYCIQDTLLPQKLVDKLDILPNQVEMSKITYVPIKYLIERGQQIKVFSQILKITREKGFLIPTLNNFKKDKERKQTKKINPQRKMDTENIHKLLKENVYDYESDSEDEDEKFKGATVLEPKRGAYLDDPITTLDFASLYPSIIMAYNLCYSTIVLEPEYDNIPGIEYKTVEWEDIEVNEKIEKVTKHYYRYAQNVESILPGQLAELAKSRKIAKKKMALETNPFKKSIFNQTQLSIKVSMNSVYGFLAAQMLTCKPIAATVTNIGRGMIEASKEWAENEFPKYVLEHKLIDSDDEIDVEVIYGDSVTGDTPLILKEPETGIVTIKTIETLSSKWKNYYDVNYLQANSSANKFSEFVKQQTETKYLVWSDIGWNPIKRVIRHKTNKKLFRIITTSGIVEVTRDHSLILNDGKFTKIKPEECKVGDKLLNSTMNIQKIKKIENENKYKISKKEAFLLGLNKNLKEEILNSNLEIKKSFLDGWRKNEL